MKSKGMKVTAVLAAVVLTTLFALPHLVDLDRFRPELESILSSSLGREVHVGHMELSLLSGGARVDEISIADDPAYSSNTFLQAKSLGVGVSLLSLIFSRSLHVTSLSLDQPQLAAIQLPSGEWNFSTLGCAAKSEGDPAKGGVGSSAMSFVLDHLKISNATIEVTSSHAGGQPTALKNIDLDLMNASFDAAMSFVLSARTDAGKLEIKGEAGPMNRSNPDQTPFHATIMAKKADLAQIASLGSFSGLGGIFNLDGTVTSDGSTIHNEGKASADKLRLVRGAQSARQTVSLQYQTDYVLAKKTGVIRNGVIVAGKNSATLSGSYDAHGKNVIVHMKIAAKQLPLDSVEGILPALGIVLPGGSKIHGGTVNADLAIDGPVDRVVTSGSAQISNAHLAGFDFGSNLSSLPGMSAAKGATDLSISTLGTHLRISADGAHLSSFNGVFAGIGGITGDGDVTSDGHLQFKMVAHVAGDGAVRFGLNHVGLKNVPNNVPFQVVGTTSMPVIIPDLSGMAKNTGKAVAKNTAKSELKKLVAAVTKNPMTAEPKTPSSPEVKMPVAVEANNRTAAPEETSAKKGGFFHRIFGRKDKHATAPNSTELAAQKRNY